MGELQDTNPDVLPEDDSSVRSASENSKKLLRQELRRKIIENPVGDHEALIRKIGDYLAGKPDGKIVAVFAALPGEVDLRLLLGRVQMTWAFPKVDGNDLVFHQVENFDKDLLKGAYGIMEPKADLSRVRIDDVDIFLCPGLGFDASGGRIGRGKGFYDRMLKQARPGASKIGVCFGYQLVDEIVMDEHDVRMDLVISG